MEERVTDDFWAEILRSEPNQPMTWNTSPQPSALTLDDYLQAIRALEHLVRPGAATMRPAAMDYRVIAQPLLTVTETRRPTRWERLRLRLENLVDAADLIYPWPRVRLSVTKPDPAVYLTGDSIICHPAVAELLKRAYV
jgi:hypothetical protein